MKIFQVADPIFYREGLKAIDLSVKYKECYMMRIGCTYLKKGGIVIWLGKKKQDFWDDIDDKEVTMVRERIEGNTNSKRGLE